MHIDFANMTPNMTTPSRNYLPTHLRRSSTTPAQRPSTSSGEAIEPISDFLADALREKKGLLPRSQSTTPRRARTGLRSQTYQATLDEWMPSSDEERRAARRGSGRPIRKRRASDLSVMKASPGSSLGTKETTSQMDKLQKENWDLKHRVALQQDRIKRLNEQLEQAAEEMDNSKDLREKNEELTEAIEILSKKVASSEEQMQDLTDMNDELVKELESRDDGIRQRQVAIEEAATIIQSLELRMESLQLVAPEPSPRQDFSDYFSGDAEVPTPQRVTPKAPPPISHATAAPDSDYFSADTSPNITPKTPRKMHIPAPKEKQVQLERAREIGASFNKEVGLRTAASRDSLFSTFLGTPDLPAPKQIGRTLRRARTPTPGISAMPQKIETIAEVTRSSVPTPPWSNTRPLRSLYEQGEFNRRIHSKTPIQRMDSTPSVTVASACASTDDIFSTTHSARNSHSPTTTVSDTATPPVPHKRIPSPATLTPTPIPSNNLPTAPSPLNYSQWPRKYPDWPPSASLSSRSILFHGDGMDHMFPVSPPKDHRHLRSSSATPDEGYQVKRPPPLARAGTTAGPPPSSSRPAGLDRRRTLR